MFFSFFHGNKKLLRQIAMDKYFYSAAIYLEDAKTSLFGNVENFLRHW